MGDHRHSGKQRGRAVGRVAAVAAVGFYGSDGGDGAGAARPDPAERAALARGGMGADRQPVLGLGRACGRVGRAGGLRRGEGRAERADADHRRRARARQRQGQRHVPRLGAHRHRSSVDVAVRGERQRADEVGVEMRSISGFEKLEYKPSEDTVQRIAKALRFPLEFFYQEEELQTIDSGAASFRSLSKMSAAQRDMALYSGALTITLNQAIERRFELPVSNLPDLRDSDPEAAAASLRRHWGIGELPIKNMIHLLEANGVRVFSLAIDAAEVDAFSMWREQKPFVFLNTLKNTERSRFDAAHELGHLVMHRHGSPNGGQEIERAANDFAAAFLMPSGSVLGYAPKFISIDVLLQLKKIWGVSISALTYRMHKLGLLTEWQYRELFVQISRRGYRKSEPESLPRETSQILGKVFTALRKEGVAKSDIAAELHVADEELDEMVFGLVLNAVKKGAGQETKPARAKPDLHLVS